MPYADAKARAAANAASDDGNYGRQARFKPEGTRIGESPTDAQPAN